MIAHNVIISKNIRLRYPDKFTIEEGSIIDDFCYFSVELSIGKHSHIAPGCSIIGGLANKCVLGDFSSFAAGTRIICRTEDYVNDLIGLIPAEFESVHKNYISGDVIFENCTGVGSNSVVMPNNYIPEGVSLGALSFVPTAFPFEPWYVYAGSPIRKIKKRNKDSVMEQYEAAKKEFVNLYGRSLT